MGERIQFVLECQSFDDHNLFFSTATFLFTLDLDLLGEGEEEGEIETRISWLEINGVIRSRKFSLIQSSSVSSSLFPLISNSSGLPPNLQPPNSLSKCECLSGDLDKTVLIDLKIQILGVCILRKGRERVATRARLTTSLYICWINPHPNFQN